MASTPTPSFADIYSLYRNARSSLPEDMSLSTFAQAANQATGTDAFSAADNGAFSELAKKGSYWIDRGLEATDLPAAMGDLGQDIFAQLGANPELGYSTFEQLPRGVVDMLPLIVPGGALSQTARLAAAGAASAANVYEKTDSPFQAIASGVAVPAMGKAGDIATEFLARSPLVKPIVEQVRNTAGQLIEQTVLRGAKDKTLAFVASELGANATAEAVNFSTQAIANGTLNPYEGMTAKDWLLSTLAGNLPYAIGDARRIISNEALPVGKPRIVDDIESSNFEQTEIVVDPVDAATAIERSFDFEKARARADAMGVVDVTERQSVLDRIEQEDQMKRRVARGEAPNMALSLYGQDVQGLKSLIDQPVSVSGDESMVKRAETRGEFYRQAMMTEIEKARQMSREEVTDTTKLASVVEDTNVLAESAARYNVPEGFDAETGAFVREAVKNEREAVTEYLGELPGSDPAEAMVDATVGTRNNVVAKVQEEVAERPPQRIVDAVEQTDNFVNDMTKLAETRPEFQRSNEMYTRALSSGDADTVRMTNTYRNWIEGLRGKEPSKAEYSQLLGQFNRTKQNAQIEEFQGPSFKRLKDESEESFQKRMDKHFEKVPGFVRVADRLNKGEKQWIPFFRDDVTLAEYKATEQAAGRTRRSPMVKAEAEATVKVLESQDKAPEMKVTKAILESRIASLVRDHARDIGMTHKDINDLIAAVKGATTDKKRAKLLEVIEGIFEGKLRAKEVRNEDSELGDVDQEQGTLYASEGENVAMSQLTPIRPDGIIPSVKDTIAEHVRLTGATAEEQALWTPMLQQVYDLFNMKDVNLGVLLNDSPTKALNGLAQMKTRSVWLSADGAPGIDGVRNKQVVLAHELGHIVDHAIQTGLAPKSVRERHAAMKSAWERDPESALRSLNELMEMLPKEYRDLPAFRDQLTASGSKTFQELYASHMAAWAALKVTKLDMAAMASVMQPETRSFFKAVSQYIRRMLGALKSAILMRPQEADPAFVKQVDGLIKFFDDAVNGMVESETAMKNMLDWMSAGTQDVWMRRTSGLYSPKDGDYAWLPSERANQPGRKPNVITDTWATMARRLFDIAKTNPVFARAVKGLMDIGPSQSAMFNKAVSSFFDGIDSVSGQLIANGVQSEYHKMMNKNKNPYLNHLTSEAMQYWTTEHLDRPFDFDELVKLNPEVQFGKSKVKLGDKLKALPAKQQAAVKHIFAANMEVHKTTMKHTIFAHEKVGQYMMMHFLKHEVPEVQWANIPNMVEQTSEAFELAKSTDPISQQRAFALLDSVRRKIGNDDAYKAALDMWAETKAGSDELQKLSNQNKGFASMMRRGKYLVKGFLPDGTERVNVVNTLSEAKAWEDNARKAGYTKFSKPELTEDRRALAFNDGVLNAVQAVEQQRAERIRQMDLPDDVRQMLLDETNISGQVARIMNSKDLTLPSYMKSLEGGKRRGVLGDMDMIETQKLHAETMSRMNARKIAKAQLSFELTNPALERFPDDVRFVKQHMEEYLKPDSQLSQAVQKLNANYYLAGNLPAMFSEMVQPFLTAVPEMMNMGLSGFKAAKMVAGATRTMASYTANALKRKLGIADDKAAINTIADPGERALFRQMVDEGHFNFGHSIETNDLQAKTAIDLKRIAGEYTPMSTWDKAKNATNILLDGAMKFYTSSQRYNMNLAALMGYRMAKERLGKDFTQQKGFDEALDFVRTTMYTGGSINRPLAQNQMGPLGAAAYGLQGYMLGWANQLMRYVNHWRGPEYLNLSQEQRKNARKAAMSMLGIQFAAAGTMGMPLIGASLKIMEKLTGQNFTGDLYQMVGEMLDEDEKEGGGLAEIVMHGAANAMAKSAGVPVDLGSRWSVDGFLGLSAYDGFDGDAVFGPMGGIVSAALAGIRTATQGDLTGGVVRASPTTIRKALTYMLNGGVKQPDGSKIELSDTEAMGYVLGFNPQRITNLSRFNQMKTAENAENSLESKRVTAEVLALFQDDPSAARRKIALEAQRSGGQESVQDIARRVATQAADGAFPKDIRRDLSGDSGEALMEIARVLGITPPEAQEVARKQYMNNIMIMLGGQPTRVSREAFQRDALGSDLSPFR